MDAVDFVEVVLPDGQGAGVDSAMEGRDGGTKFPEAFLVAALDVTGSTWRLLKEKFQKLHTMNYVFSST